jgi:hypothetical protein
MERQAVDGITGVCVRVFPGADQPAADLQDPFAAEGQEFNGQGVLFGGAPGGILIQDARNFELERGPVGHGGSDRRRRMKN